MKTAEREDITAMSMQGLLTLMDSTAISTAVPSGWTGQCACLDGNAMILIQKLSGLRIASGQILFTAIMDVLTEHVFRVQSNATAIAAAGAGGVL